MRVKRSIKCTSTIMLILAESALILTLQACSCNANNSEEEYDVGRQDIMLQAFYWNSQNETGWKKLMSHVDEIGRNFSCVWLPPSAAASEEPEAGGSDMGYHPMAWSNQNSCWGTAQDLKTLNNELHKAGVKVIADIVVNHRAGHTGWDDFCDDDFGSLGKFKLGKEHICKDDEVNTVKGTATGAMDTGENWSGARDLDHTSEYVQKEVKAYLSWLKDEMGYDGWRYDLVKGYDGQYVSMYDKSSEPYLSVGECWDSSYDVVSGWIASTGRRTMAFDFPAKYAIFNNGLAKGDFSCMMWKEDFATPRPAGLIHHRKCRPYAVTFIDNHDTYRDDNRYTGDVAQAYAVLLASPGVPCVFWCNWRENTDVINRQIAVRKKVGIGAESECLVNKCDKYYESISTGLNGTLICRVGTDASTDVPEGYCLEASGNGWWYYVKIRDKK